MKKLLWLSALVLMLVPGTILADEERKPGSGERFERVKAMRIEMLTERLACVQAAQDRWAMKNCHEKKGKRNKERRRKEGYQEED